MKFTEIFMMIGGSGKVYIASFISGLEFFYFFLCELDDELDFGWFAIAMSFSLYYIIWLIGKLN